MKSLVSKNLSGAIFSYTRLNNLYLNNANLSGTQFEGANLSGAYLTSANLSKPIATIKTSAIGHRFIRNGDRKTNFGCSPYWSNQPGVPPRQSFLAHFLPLVKLQQPDLLRSFLDPLSRPDQKIWVGWQILQFDRCNLNARHRQSSLEKSSPMQPSPTLKIENEGGSAIA